MEPTESEILRGVTRLRQVLQQALACDEAARPALVARELADEPALAREAAAMLPYAAAQPPLLPPLVESIEALVAAAVFAGEDADAGLAAVLTRYGGVRREVLALVARLEALHFDLRRRLGNVWRWSRGAGRYEVGEALGAGGLGQVFAARDQLLGRRVAYKTIHQKRGTSLHAIDPALVHRFLDEAQISAQLQHPAIPPVHDLGIGPAGVPFFTLRWIRGRTLHDEIQQQGGHWTRSVVDAARVLVRAADALAYAHSVGVLHRDVSARNVMVGRFGEVCVIDWGLARRLDAADAPAEPRVAVDREVGLDTGAVGTPGYRSPEAMSGSFTSQNDVFGLAAVLHTMLVGAPPSVTTQPRRLVHTRLDPRRHDRRLAFVCARGLAAEPAARYPTMAAMRDDLEAIVGGGDPAGMWLRWDALAARWARRLGFGLRHAMGWIPNASVSAPSGLGAKDGGGRVSSVFTAVGWPLPQVQQIAAVADRGTNGKKATKHVVAETMRQMASRCSPPERYATKSHLSRGGQGEVNLAEDLLLRRQLVIKRLHDWCADQVEADEDTHISVFPGGLHEGLTRFLDEGQIQAQIDHPGVLCVHEIVVTPSGVPLLVLPFADGGTLGDCIATTEDWRAHCELLLQAAWGLAHAHRKGVVHRDVKPGNILLGGHRDAYLADWGLAVVLGTPEFGETGIEVRRGSGHARQTRNDEERNYLVGTLAYMAPEVALGEGGSPIGTWSDSPIGTWSDVWSLGATLYEVLVGEQLFASAVGLSSFEYLRAIPSVRVTRRAIRRANRAVPAAVADVCVRCLQQDPMARYQDAAAFARALQDALSQ